MKSLKFIISAILIISIIQLSFSELNANVKLPKLIGNGMILQRNTDVKIWGWADPDEIISVHFIDSNYKTTAGSNGEWVIILKKLDAGGPYEMTITGNNNIIISDILIGDVWVCSGQSNMELPMSRVSWIYPEEIANCENSNIRQFYVAQTYNFNEPQTDLPWGEWKSVNPQNILKFSAAGYFFAKEIYNKYKVPVGLINNALGGSPAEAWISEEALKEFPVYYNEAQKFKDKSLIEQTEENDKIRIKAWYDLLWSSDLGYKNRDLNWWNPSLNCSDWDSIHMPGYWSGTKLNGINGVVWFRKDIEISGSMAEKPGLLILGRIVDADSVFVNGTFVGSVSYQYPPRRYAIPAGLLKEGKNTIVVRVISNIGNGGFVPDKKYTLTAGDQIVLLDGFWKYKVGAVMKPLEGQTFVRWKPTGLYNAMVSPLMNYSIKGVIWYQGESNTGRSVEYTKLLPALINNWRTGWKQGDFPFLIVQLPNFMDTKEEPGESDWAELRKAQLKALSVSNTGLIVTIDLGEWNDIHPVNKKDIGLRIALAAQKVAYGENNVTYSGPIFKSFKTQGNQIVLTFENTGEGLIAKDNKELFYFAIAGADKQFVWAKAIIKGNKVIVWNDNIRNPVAVRYAWADNPEGANLYNKEGLPASPFRTDNW